MLETVAVTYPHAAERQVKGDGIDGIVIKRLQVPATVQRVLSSRRDLQRLSDRQRRISSSGV